MVRAFHVKNFTLMQNMKDDLTKSHSSTRVSPIARVTKSFESYSNNGLNPISFLTIKFDKHFARGNERKTRKVRNPIKLISLMLLLSRRLTSLRVSRLPSCHFPMISNSNFSIFFVIPFHFHGSHVPGKVFLPPCVLHRFTFAESP